MASGLRKGGALYRLLYGDDEGTVRLFRGTVSYRYSEDKFRVRNNAGEEVLLSDLGEHVERWLIREGWVNVRSQ